MCPSIWMEHHHHRLLRELGVTDAAHLQHLHPGQQVLVAGVHLPPEASRTCSPSSPTSNCPWTPATRAWPSSTRSGSWSRRPSPANPPLRTRPPSTSVRADISRPNGSASSTPSPRPKPGESSSATTASGSTWPRSSMPRVPGLRSGRPAADHLPHNPPGQHAPTSTANIVVICRPRKGIEPRTQARRVYGLRPAASPGVLRRSRSHWTQSHRAAAARRRGAAARA